MATNNSPVAGSSPVNFKDLARVLTIASDVYEGKTSNMLIQQGAKVSMEDDMGKSHTFTLTEDPLNHLGMTVVQEFRSDPGTALSLMLRYFALVAAFDDPRLKRWRRICQDNPGYMEHHPAILMAAAKMPLDDQALFDTDAFVKAVDWLVRDCYGPEGNLLVEEVKINLPGEWR